MPEITAPYDPAIGPIVDVEVAHPKALLRPGSVPLSHAAKFLIDTGSRHSHVASHIATQLALVPAGLVPITTMNGVRMAETYPADVIFTPIGRALQSVVLREFSQSSLNYGGIMGRDILAFGTFTLDGSAKIFRLSFN
jgi:hypothetical protein